MAQELLGEPRLGRLHEAGMHMLLSTTPSEYVEHGLEAVRLYGDILQRQDLNPARRANIEKLHRQAQALLDKARHDKAEIAGRINDML